MRLPLVVGCLLCLLSRRSSGIHLKTPEKAAKSLADTPPPKNQLAARLARLPEPGEEGYNVTVYNRTGACPSTPTRTSSGICPRQSGAACLERDVTRIASPRSSVI